MELLDRAHAREVVAVDDFRVHPAMQPYGGHRYTLADGPLRGVLEVVQLAPQVLLLLNHCRNYPANEMTQIVSDGRWMHLQFRFNGNSTETLGADPQMIDANEGSCLITSYAGATTIRRISQVSAVQKTACLYLRPEQMQSFFRIPAMALPDRLRWIVDGSDHGTHHHIARLHSASFAAVNDMLGCNFSSHTRAAYMQAKAMELVALMLQSLISTEADTPPALNSRDVAGVRRAKEIIDSRWSEPLTLQTLAAMVGLNRTKLTVGFRQAFGVPVNAYWREKRLTAARDMLRAQNVAVSTVALRVGYAELSSFTRAFTARFGFSPKSLRSQAGQAEIELERGTHGPT
jgi:AraC-like DNA-binding protein